MPFFLVCNKVGGVWCFGDSPATGNVASMLLLLLLTY